MCCCSVGVSVMCFDMLSCHVCGLFHLNLVFVLRVFIVAMFYGLCVSGVAFFFVFMFLCCALYVVCS